MHLENEKDKNRGKKEIIENKRNIEVIYCGGTISSLATEHGYREGGHKVDLLSSLEEQFPGSTSQIKISGTHFAYLGLSENIDFSHWETIGDKVRTALSRHPKAIVLTHGTDSMEQTARYLRKEFGQTL